jgi:hypothetical protein
MNEKVSYVKIGVIGLVMGIIGAIVGFIPMEFLHSLLYGILGSYIPRGGPSVLLFLISGYPMIWGEIIILPIGGAIFGFIGSFIGLKRQSSRLWLWGGVAGFLFNLFVSFWAQ